MDRWWDIVEVLMNFKVPLNAEIFLTSSELVSFSGTVLCGASK